MSSKQKFCRAFAKVDKVYVGISNVLSNISGVCLLVAMLLAFFDVILAKLFNSGVPGQYELIQMLSVPMLYLTMSYTQLTRDQIKLTLVLDKVPHALAEFFIYLGYVLGAFISFFIAWHSSRNVVKLFNLHSITSGTLKLPQWPFCLMLVIGCVLLGIAYIFTIIRRILKFNEYVDKPDLGHPEDGITPNIAVARDQARNGTDAKGKGKGETDV